MMSQIDTFLTKASVKGLRTLLMSVRILDESEYNAFDKEVRQAEDDIMNRDKLLAEIYNKFETGLVLLGATAVEDRL
jgi:hypothetical protein